MAFTHAGLSLFYTLPLSTVDWGNLLLSKTRRVMLVADFADKATLSRLASMGVRVTARINEGQYDTDDKRKEWADKVGVMAQNGVDTVVIGCEPDNGFDLTWASRNWGNQGGDDIWRHAKSSDLMRSALAATGVRCVSAGLTCAPERITEDGPPMPGRISWVEECRWANNEMWANGFHLYALGWRSIVDVHRMKWILKQGIEENHRGCYIDEVGVLEASDMKKAECYVQLATRLLQPPYRDRVEALTIFCANGTPNGQWPKEFLLRDPAAYRLIGEFMDGRNYPLPT